MARLKHNRHAWADPGKAKYLKSLNTDYWREVKRMVHLRDHFACVDCGSKLKLEVHHLTYAHRGLELEHLEDCVTVCETCHKKRHKRRWKR